MCDQRNTQYMTKVVSAFAATTSAKNPTPRNTRNPRVDSKASASYTEERIAFVSMTAGSAATEINGPTAPTPSTSKTAMTTMATVKSARFRFSEAERSFMRLKRGFMWFLVPAGGGGTAGAARYRTGGAALMNGLIETTPNS